ncbi:MAG: ATP-dependent Clp protease proteolytic subunit [Lachnospiraceae bacterium]|nr:ATP-dependent Clp protease proteolytic subunit [Lachnospiraceae bacterium]
MQLKNRTLQENNKNTDTDSKSEQEEKEEHRSDRIKETGQATLDDGKCKIHLMTIIGEIEGHENAVSGGKATKYDHLLPELAAIEDSSEVDGVLILLNTAGGDIDAGLAIAEMIASLSKPTVSLVLGGSHSIGVPLAVASDYSFIVPTGTMLVHPVRMTGMIIGAPQTYEYFKRMQDRITGFIASHSRASQEKLEQMMMNTGELTKDLGTILIGETAVKEGLIDEVGGIREALKKLHEMIDDRKKGKD